MTSVYSSPLTSPRQPGAIFPALCSHRFRDTDMKKNWLLPRLIDCEGHLSFITSGIEQVYNALVPILKSQALVLRLPSYPLHPLAAALFTSLWPRTS